ncbi:KUP/HAK/KT family potassium transporter [[Flexibacter] sp. ATCC 35208]|uniref:KUP/HAK/KT family potassium transporter n=1 Tax=[Flexibacter] sp. ATCC 35208 TaxID=1936242 RepID=UPI0009D45D42|nr:KUP/HAK/KT family potassium transporter [[Flexibacter] sp. ATCC 35208]OMP75878.1 potassium transporter Kup [[Flexibacter] sp. ATCC 35208]
MELSVQNTQEFHKQIKAAGMLIAIGIVFGDIGTSPLYTYTALFKPDEIINPAKALGVLSCVIWTLTLQTTFKYIFITLQADNKGEGGIFSLFALIKRYYRRWLIVVAIIGGSFLVADGIITPPISVASAIEGMKAIYPNIDTVPIVIAIIILLFVIQQFGTQQIGKFFGPVMMTWFTFIGAIGVMALSHNFSVLKALNPVYAYELLTYYPKGFWLLGGIFLCTTGAEAMYSDMGHVGRNNIRVSWIYIKITLILCYAGQTAWLLEAGKANTLSPFYNIVPQAIYVPSVILSTLATIIASQALISGCFTLANEAIHLGFWPRHKIVFPSNIRGQLYIPFFNWALMIACIGMVLHFRESGKMEAAFGLSVTLTMLTTTILIALWLRARRKPLIVVGIITALFLTVEISFLIANLQKVKEGGWIMLFVGAFLTFIMLVWRTGRLQQKKLITFSKLQPENLQRLIELSHHNEISNFATNLIYLTTSADPNEIENKTLRSIFSNPIKKADVYWFFHVEIDDEPYTLQYSVTTLSVNDVYHVTLRLGFRVQPRVDLFFRHIANELVSNGELKLERSPMMEFAMNDIGDYKFIIINSYLSFDNDLPFWRSILIKCYYNLKGIGVTEDVNYGLDTSNVIIEKYPLVYTNKQNLKIQRIDNCS